MGLVGTVRNRLFDPDQGGRLSSNARAKRWREFERRFPAIGQMKVLDLGGRPAYWEAAPVKPAHVRCVNLESGLGSDEPWIDYVQGDACAPQSGTFDLVVSNSLIEHVGGHEPRLRLAEAIHTAADHHWVQTPYRYFPIEPHWLFPGFQFLPPAIARRVSESWKLGHIRSTREGSWSDVAWVELLTITDMRGYFPDSEIWPERWAGLVKSMVAIC